MSVTHAEVPVKVTAWIDEKVVPLVLALNEFDDVMTLDSCQADATGSAYVMFCSRKEPQVACAFAIALAAVLAERGADLDYTFRAEWHSGTGEPLLKLSCPPEAIKSVANLLSACRTTLWPNDRAHTEPRNSMGRRHHQRPAL